MGKVILSDFQIEIINLLSSDLFFPHNFYFTGGTALSAFYYHHRQSEDLDFFSFADFDQDYVRSFMRKQKDCCGWDKIKYTQVFERQTYEIRKGKDHLKLEFVPYKFKQIRRSNLVKFGFKIDSLQDIAINKLLCISQRTTTKDFVDLYYVLKDYTIWDLRRGVEVKFGLEFDPIYIGSLLMKIDDVQTMPLMYKKLTLNQLRNDFHNLAKQLGKKLTK